MCYNYEYLKKKASKLEGRSEEEELVDEGPKQERVQFYHANGFEGLKLPVITNDNPTQEQLLHWGMIPHYFKPPDILDPKKKFQLLNKRADDAKPIWKAYFEKKRCLVPASAFFEWRHVGKKKFPYRIHLKNEEPFFFAGIWNQWTNEETGEIIFSYAVLTTEANDLMAKIHNSKKRMPIILKQENAKEYLGDFDMEGKWRALTSSVSSEDMEAYPISKAITSKTLHPNRKEVSEKYSYNDLPPLN